MKRYWIITSALALIVYALFGVCGCFTGLTHLGGINNGGPTVGAKITAAALDVVTMPVQLPVFIIAGIGAGLDKLDRSIEDSSWRSKREDLHSKFLKDPERMQRETSPAFSHRGLDLGLVYKDEAIPLGERFLVANVMQYYAYVRGMSPIGGDDEMAALLHRKEWTADGLRAVAPQIYLGRRHYPAPDYVTLAYLSNPKTPPDIIDAFMKHPSFKYRDAEDYCRTMRDEIATNIVARMERSMPPPSRGDEEDDSPAAQFTRFLGNNPDTPSRIFIIRLDCPSEIRFWPPREYGSGHVWFADKKI